MHVAVASCEDADQGCMVMRGMLRRMLRWRMVAIDDNVDGDDDEEEEQEEATLFTELCVRMWCWWWEP